MTLFTQMGEYSWQTIQMSYPSNELTDI